MPRGVRAAPTVKTCKIVTQFRTEHSLCNLVAETRIIFTWKWSNAHGWYGLPYSANRWFCTQLLSFLVANVFNSINCDVTPCNFVVIFQRFGWFYCIHPSQEIRRTAHAASTNAEYKHTWNSFCIPSRMYNLYFSSEVNNWFNFTLSLPWCHGYKFLLLPTTDRSHHQSPLKCLHDRTVHRALYWKVKWGKAKVILKNCVKWQWTFEAINMTRSNVRHFQQIAPLARLTYWRLIAWCNGEGTLYMYQL